MSSVKQKLLEHCHRWVDERIEMIKSAMADAQASGNEEIKSSMGDKYETARSMAQLEIEKHSFQLAELHKQKELLNRVSIAPSREAVELGSLVHCDTGKFFLSISAGGVSIGEIEYTCLSPRAPLATAMVGKVAGDHFIFNKRDWKILSIE